jgi:DnaJ-class molecular chaperone
VNASTDDIRKAYTRKALRLHPDKNPDPAAKDLFQKLNKIYNVLKNEKTRNDYDMYGEEGGDDEEDVGEQCEEDNETKDESITLEESQLIVEGFLGDSFSSEGKSLLVNVVLSHKSNECYVYLNRIERESCCFVC